MTDARPDYTRNCGECPHIAAEEWAPGKVAYRCLAPGFRRGYVVGNGRMLPYVPAWCPVRAEREAAGNG